MREHFDHTQFVTDEQRRLYEYWRTRRAAPALPARGDIDPRDFKDILGFISLVDVIENEPRYRVRLAGTRLRDIYDQDITGKALDDLPWGAQKDYWRQAHDAVVARRRPVCGSAPMNWPGREHLTQSWIKMPLSEDGQRVSMILSFDTFAPHARLWDETQSFAQAS